MFVSYVLSYVFIGIYWVNHHHLMHAVERVNGSILWRNLLPLFWLSQVPFTTGWMGENHFAPLPTARLRHRAAECGHRLLPAGAARSSPTTARNRASRPRSGRDFKGKISVLIYVVAVPMAFVNRWVACAIYVLVALIWFVPDRRIERVFGKG